MPLKVGVVGLSSSKVEKLSDSIQFFGGVFGIRQPPVGVNLAPEERSRRKQYGFESVHTTEL